jgi:hypothetical protein
MVFLQKKLLISFPFKGFFYQFRLARRLVFISVLKIAVREILAASY